VRIMYRYSNVDVRARAGLTGIAVAVLEDYLGEETVSGASCRPVAFYTDKASLFQTAPKIARDSKQVPRDEREPLPPPQNGRALRELGTVWAALQV
jgi:hypothetical protein